MQQPAPTPTPTIHYLLPSTLSSRYSYQKPQPPIITELVEQALSAGYIKYRDNCLYHEEEEFMRREYLGWEFQKKIGMLSQYYKFHRDLPVWNQRQVQTIMGDYYAKLKNADYKKIKEILKREQNISLTTHQSFSSFQQSDYTKRSRYSTMLNQLESSADEDLLRDLCERIGNAFKKVKVQDNFKGTYYSGQKKFQEFLRKQKKRKQSVKEQKAKKQHKLKMPQKPKSKQPQGLKQIQLSTNHRQMPQPPKHPHPKPSQISIPICPNQQKSTLKNPPTRPKQLLPTSSRSSLSHAYTNTNTMNKKSRSKEHLLNFYENGEFGRGIVRNVKIFHGGFGNQNWNLKSLNQIYKGEAKKECGKDEGKARSRSNTAHNLHAEGFLSKNKSKKQLISTLKTNRSTSRKSIPISVAKGSVIQLGQIQQKNQPKERTLPSRQNSQKSLRASTSKSKPNLKQKQFQNQSHSNLSHMRTQSQSQIPTISLAQVQTQPPAPHYPPHPSHPSHPSQSHTQSQYNSKISANEKIFGKKRNSVIENMLEKKLFAFKRKQAVL